MYSYALLYSCQRGVGRVEGCDGKLAQQDLDVKRTLGSVMEAVVAGSKFSVQSLHTRGLIHARNKTDLREDEGAVAVAV